MESVIDIFEGVATIRGCWWGWKGPQLKAAGEPHEAVEQGLGRVRAGLVPDIAQGIRGIRDQLPHPNLCVRMASIADRAHQFLNVGLCHAATRRRLRATIATGEMAQVGLEPKRVRTQIGRLGGWPTLRVLSCFRSFALPPTRAQPEPEAKSTVDRRRARRRPPGRSGVPTLPKNASGDRSPVEPATTPPTAGAATAAARPGG